MTHNITLALTSLDLLPRSLAALEYAEFGLAHAPDGLQLCVLAPWDCAALHRFAGTASELDGKVLLLCPLTAYNAASLRELLPWLQPRPLGLQTSAGMGDRLGLATPGHVRAVRAAGSQVAPIFAQQSIREMTRTGRTPQQVMDDATWGIFAEGWQGGVGADADHLKTPADIDTCLPAGFTFFTIDPGGFVDQRAEAADPSRLRQLAEQLPPEAQPHASGLTGRVFDIEGLTIQFDEYTLLKAAVKYGAAVAHVAAMYHHLVAQAGERPVELEVSVDETEQPTSHAEHVYIASLLQQMGVRWVSLAPRYVGRFEKGVDYIGSLEAFEADFAGHAAIARCFGGYKLSLHSGSDKFSIYPIASRLAQGRVHLKTAGTSYLEALRTIAGLDPALFGEIYRFARERYATDRVTYHVSADPSLAGAGLALGKNGLPAEHDLPRLLDDFHAREILHVTYGSVLTEKTWDGRLCYYDRLVALLRAHPEAYAQNLENHFVKHLTPFIR
jgi:hypothetical protein